jgi:tryptophan-rich sensory protein
MKKLVISILICVGIGAIAGFVTAGESSSDWYMNLQKPSFQPPSWLFSPVWTFLYIMMGIALWMVWKKPNSRERNIAITIFFAQLLFNFLWSIIFFNWHGVGMALIDILVLWVLILSTIFSFGKLSKTAAWLLVPYISWVTFATILNYAIWQMN